MYSKLSHVTISSHNHGVIATDPPVCGACPGDAGKSGTRSAKKRESSQLWNSVALRACRGPQTPLQILCETGLHIWPTPLRARVPAVASGSVASGGMSKRKGGSHLENALAKFQCVPLRNPRLRSAFGRPSDVVVVFRRVRHPSSCPPPR